MIRQIVVHPGGAHKDDFLACSLLVAEHEVPIFRREPWDDDLEDATIAVVDVGHRWEDEKMNFDHHQFARDAEPMCALSLVLQHLGLYEDALKFCDWLEVTEWIDTRGPNATASWLEVSRESMMKLNSPIDMAMLRRFAMSETHYPGQPIYELMKMIGQDLLSYIRGMKERLEFLDCHAVVWELRGGKKALFLPKTDPMPTETSMGMARYLEEKGLSEEVVALIYPDRRGAGYGLSRFNDHPQIELTRIEGEKDVHFAHVKGFVAKTSAQDEARLKDLLEMAWID